MTDIVKKNPFLSIFIASLLVRALAALANVGFVAIDDYVYMLKLAFPAQSAPSYRAIIDSSWVHPTIPMLTLAFLSRIPLALGFEDPLHQIRAVYLLMGLWSLLCVFFAYRLFDGMGRRREGLVAAFLVGLHGIMPFFSTRVLFETFSMTFLTASLFFFTKYRRTLSRTDLFLSVLSISLASLVRYQSGVCFLAILGLVFFTKRFKRDRLFLAAVALFFFVLTGLFDLLLQRHFHQSLLDYIKYNIFNSSQYGVSKPWNYALLFIGATLPPFLLLNWRGFHWKEKYRDLQAPLWFFLVFLATHSAIPHKEDRFMIPIFPIFFILLAPMIQHLIEEKHTIRLKAFGTLNFLILILTSVFTSQWNTIGTARFLHRHTNYKKLVNFEDSLVFMPSAYMNRPLLSTEEAEERSLEIEESCDVLYAVREDRLEAFRSLRPPVRETAVSQPGPLEWLIVKLNPKRNGRRAAIHLFTHEKCS